MTAAVHRLAHHLVGAVERPAAASPRPGAEGAFSGETRGGEGLVTPLPSPTFGKSGGVGAVECPFFVDWLSVSQAHPQGGLPEVDSGCVMGIDEDGQLRWKTTAAVKHEGSFETSLHVRCDGFRVWFSGNVSRFGRAENVWGFDFWECMRRVNSVLAHYGLPPFTAGTKREELSKGELRYVWSGARISRIDMTANYEAGSADNAHAYMQWLGTQHVGRHEGRRLGQGETVAWGGGKRQYWKAYLKHLELMHHKCEDQRVIDHCAARGMVRFEGTLRSDALTRFGAAYLGDYESGWAMGELIRVFNEHAAVGARAERSTDELDELPTRLRGVARDYLAGMDMRARLSKSAFYRHRAALLPFGIDIAVRNVLPFQPRVRVIELRRAEVPSWYQLAA